MRSGNPALNDKTFLDIGSGAVFAGESTTMTIGGTVNKAALMLLMLVVAAAWTWSMVGSVGSAGEGIAVSPWLVPAAGIGFIGSLAAFIALLFKKTWAPVLAPAYAVFEGLVLGAISAFFELQFPGIVMQAVMLTFGTLAALLMAYRSGLIKATENFKLGVVAATGAIALLYLVNIGMRLFGFGGMPFIHDSGAMGIAFSLFVVTIAALNLVLDFDFIESGAEAGAPKYMEWYAAFGLMVTLVWLYLEILRLLSKLRD
jgi:uncharacterized YccA/Bax inhibitor family protein